MTPEQPRAVHKKTPPYVAYKTFISFVDSLKKAMPGRIDRSIMHTMSGGTQSHMTHSLRSMDLINEHGTPNESFTKLVNSEGDDRKKALIACLVAGYPFLFTSGKIDLTTATGKQLLEQFENVGLRGDSIRRTVAFFLGAAKDAGMKLSPYFNKIQSRSAIQKPRNGGPTTTDDVVEPPLKPSAPKPKQEKEEPSGAWAQQLLSKFPDFDPKWPDEIKTKWFEAFERLMNGGPT